MISEQEDDTLWAQELAVLTNKAKKVNLPHQIGVIKTFQDKVCKVLENPSVLLKITTYISKCSEIQHKKNGSTATKLRDQGNEKYGCRDNKSALKLYTESVICAPEIGPELSLAFGNRSAVLFNIGHYQAAFSDIQIALSKKFPKNLEYKLFMRKAQCLIRMSRYEEAVTVLQECQESVPAAKLPEDKSASLLRDVAAMQLECKQLMLQQTNSTGNNRSESLRTNNNSLSNQSSLDASSDGLPGWTEVSNISDSDVEEFLPNASPKLVLKKDKDDKIRGRYVVTNDMIEEGEVLFCEAPFSSVLLPDQYSSHCHQCYRTFLAPVPCRKCTQPRYCSLDCAEEAWIEHHQYECGHLDLLHSLGVGHLAIRTVLCAGLPKLLSIQKMIENGSYLPSNSDAYSRVHNLTHHLDPSLFQEDEIFQYCVTAALLATFLARKTTFLLQNNNKNASLFPPKPDPDSVPENLVHFVGGQILRHLCQLVGNAHAITELQESDNGDVQQVRVGTAIYTSASMMNHCCQTSIVNHFRGKTLIVRSTLPLTCGDEVYNCYGPHVSRHTYLERQEMLANQYKFRCRCPVCSDPEKKNIIMLYDAYKCPRSHCTGAVIDNVCNSCNNNHSCDNYHQVRRNIEVDLDMAERLKEAGPDIASTFVEQLLKLEKSYSNILYKHNVELARLRDALARALVTAGSYERAAKYSRLSLEATEARFGPRSIEVGHELLKLTDIICCQITDRDGLVDMPEFLNLLQRAMDIFKLHYGPKCKYYLELKEKLSGLQATGS